MIHLFSIFPFLLFLIVNTTEAQTNQGPNILVIVPDDLGWSDVGYQGSEILTPNIDRLARNGKILEQFYVMPTCTPTRVSLMTGKFPSRFGVLAPAYGEVIDLGAPTLPSLLQEAGYFTAIVGKWHMGSPPYTPLKYRFDQSYGYFDGQIDPYTHEYKTETAQTDRKSWHRNDHYLEEEGHVTDLLTAEAVAIIREPREKPFFLYLAHHVPHYPLDEPKKYLSLYDDRPQMHPSRKLFAASVSHLDEGIGKILQALEETGQRENTVILFLSDNGGQKSWSSTDQYRGKYADKPHVVLGNNFPLRGWKGDLYEGGIRVPGIINWEGRLPSGKISVPIHMSDWLPTLLEISGTTTQEANQLDGESVWTYLQNPQTRPATARSFYWKIKGASAVRQGDWKLVVREDGRTELYQLKDDFRETQDQSKQHPNKVKSLMTLLESYQKSDRD
ncbi:sulfatase-like hydrolase/transferase [Cyclobacterium jeungdonense]|uniref:Sulfatase-like hydrolase/transferase n=1 Tax=Cyclobacterium jeungdonense TaxID=708087 RepID=A0ABT8C0D3_9BACT|nr:sulfatase-like hydrolase/transferase [Cyclobacterium jeungdonense]MDN3686260.1 sulfatase-like hydrolase/transferase [Cyclobacterium jeungdonense]